MGSATSRVFVQYRNGTAVMSRLLDLAYVDGSPIAVVSWIVRGGVRMPGEYAELDPALLRPSGFGDAFWYDGIAEPASRRSR